MTAMTVSTRLNRVVLTRAGETDPDAVLICVAGSSGMVGGGSNRVDQSIVEGGFRNYANGNTRLILGTATQRNQTIVLRALTPTQVAAVAANTGTIVCLRDSYGRRLFGSYLETDNTDIPLSGGVADDSLLTDVAITFTSVTYDEEV